MKYHALNLCVIFIFSLWLDSNSMRLTSSIHKLNEKTQIQKNNIKEKAHSSVKSNFQTYNNIIDNTNNLNDEKNLLKK